MAWFILFLIGLTLIALGLVLLYKNRPRALESSVETALILTEFNPTFFEIYDHDSTKTVCNRLIIVQPFGWLILARGGMVFVLNDTLQTCSLGYTPSVLVPTSSQGNLFKSVCLEGDLALLVNAYKKFPPVFEQFDVTNSTQKNKFTILDALNILFTKWITITTTPPGTATLSLPATPSLGDEVQRKLDFNNDIAIDDIPIHRFVNLVGKIDDLHQNEIFGNKFLYIVNRNEHTFFTPDKTETDSSGASANYEIAYGPEAPISWKNLMKAHNLCVMAKNKRVLKQKHK